jgi:hypothetical protein
MTLVTWRLLPADVQRLIFDLFDRNNLEICLKVCRAWRDIIEKEQNKYLGLLSEFKLKKCYLSRIWYKNRPDGDQLIMFAIEQELPPKQYYLYWKKTGKYKCLCH